MRPQKLSAGLGKNVKIKRLKLSGDCLQSFKNFLPDPIHFTRCFVGKKTLLYIVHEAY